MNNRRIALILVLAAAPIAVLALREPVARWQNDRAWSASFLSHRKALEDIRSALLSYRKERGDWPDSIDDLVALHPELSEYFMSSPPYELRLHNLRSADGPDYLLVPDPRFVTPARGRLEPLDFGIGLFSSGEIKVYRDPDL